MKKIKVELDACKEKFKEGTRPFLEHLVQTHAKDASSHLNDENCKDAKIKRTILKFIAVTHPDKHTGKERHVQLLYEEITKMLNEIYERYKNVATTEDD